MSEKELEIVITVSDFKALNERVVNQAKYIKQLEKSNKEYEEQVKLIKELADEAK